MNAAKPAKAATAGLFVGATPLKASGDVELGVEVSTGYLGWPSVASVMIGEFGTMVLAGVTSGVLGVAGVASTSGVVVLVSISFSGVITTTGVGRAVLLTSVLSSFSGVGVLTIVVGVLEIVVSIVVGVKAKLSISVSVSFFGV